MGCHVWEGTTIATHLRVALDVREAGPVALLTKWRRPRAPVPEHLRHIIGSLRLIDIHVAVLLGGPEREPFVCGQVEAALKQEDVDRAWGCWLKSAAGELAEATTGLLECVSEKCDVVDLPSAGGQSWWKG